MRCNAMPRVLLTTMHSNAQWYDENFLPSAQKLDHLGIAAVRLAWRSDPAT